ncbi:MAG: sigma-54 dependent transcriptional regulator [Mariprofundales bacterium]|nr:sigma-54 dependent transcriptional regulator [Mariprofundales bacterium]
MTTPLHLIGFPSITESDLHIQLGKLLPDAPIESTPQELARDFTPPEGAIIFIWDGRTVSALVHRLFQHDPQANIVVLTETGAPDRATELMRMGIMDYRMLPCPDDVMQIYLRKAGHQTELARQAKVQRQGSDLFITEDVDTRRLLDHVALIAPSNASVLVVGESGTGKERISRYIHQCSPRIKSAFIAINCAAIPEGVLESELFGHEKGAFTGATSSRPGKFEIAHEGTLLLDEITEMPLHLQAKLLRVLQEGEVDRLGGRKPIKVDVRVIATSNRNIEESVANGEFRQDLYFRLNVVTIKLPALRDRPNDIMPLAQHFLAQFSQMYGTPVPSFNQEASDNLIHYSWPGNVRELENCMHRAFLMSASGSITSDHLGLNPSGAIALKTSKKHADIEVEPEMRAGMSIRDMERVLIEQTLEHVRGNRTEAAKLLGISIRTLRNKLNEYSSGTPVA